MDEGRASTERTLFRFPAPPFHLSSQCRGARPTRSQRPRVGPAPNQVPGSCDSGPLSPTATANGKSPWPQRPAAGELEGPLRGSSIGTTRSRAIRTRAGGHSWRRTLPSYFEPYSMNSPRSRQLTAVRTVRQEQLARAHFLKSTNSSQPSDAPSASVPGLASSAPAAPRPSRPRRSTEHHESDVDLSPQKPHGRRRRGPPAVAAA